PIEDLQGRNIGFGARVLPSDPRAGEQAKYLNTAETPIYRKQEILYNLHRARSTVARSGEAFVVEGYTDVIGLAQAGIDNVVAAALPYLQQLADPVRRSEYAGMLADLSGVSESSVLQSLERRLGGRPTEVAKAIKRSTAQERVEREMLKLLAANADTFRDAMESLTEDHFRTAANRRLFVALRDADGDVSSI